MVNVNASPIPCALRSIPRPRTAAPRHGLPSAGKRRRGRLSFPVMTFLLLLILFTATAARAEKVVVVGGDQAYPPYEFLDQDGHPAGYNVELTRAIAEVMGVKVQIRLGDWEEMRKALADGSIDILEGMVYSKERARKFDFSPPHSFVNESVFARKGAQPVTSLEQLRGKEVIVQRGGFSHDYLVNKHVGAKLILVETHREALRLLAAGKGDYALVGNLPGLYLGRKLGLSNVVPVGKPFSGQPYGYAVKKGNEKILAQFSEGLALLKKTGRQQQIYDRWLGPLEPRGIPWKKIVLVGGMVFGPLLIVLGGIVVWNRSLKKEVERRTRDLQLQQQQLIQADKMASLGILVSGVAHEINNPTGLILYNLPVLSKAYQVAEAGLETRFRDEGDFMIGGLRYSTLREEVPRLFAEMQDGARRIKRIVEDLKDFARQETADLSDSVDLNAVVQASVRLVENSIKKATSRFEVRYAEGLPPFRGNAQRIEQVVVNLILNACQSLNHPDRGIFLRTFAEDPEKEVILEVRDEGAGIPEEHLSHLTAPFFTTKREQGGTGLGLSVSSGIVEDHRGRLAFTSAPGQGTIVTLALHSHEKGIAP